MDTVELQIESLAYQGAGVAHLNSGKTVFVAGAAPGDVVEAQIADEKPTYCTASLVEIRQMGLDRVVPFCPHAESCGGCSWQHVSYGAQLSAKRDAVRSALSHVGGVADDEAQALVAEPIASPKERNYRNKLELACTRNEKGQLVLGMHEAKGGNAVPLAQCALAHPAISDAPKRLQGALRYLEGTSDLGVFRVGIRKSEQGRSCEVAIWTTPGSFPRQAAAKTIASALDATSIVRVIADPGKSRRVKQVEVLSGEGNWQERVGKFGYRVSAPSFFQVNTPQAEQMVQLATDALAGAKDGAIADLYAGVGTFTLPLAQIAGEMYAVESSGPAVRDLRRNAESAGVDIEVVGGDSAREIASMGSLDALLVDPPRAGLGKDMPGRIADAGPKTLVYVSCDPATWARDARSLHELGYELKHATPIDLFPQTYHIEVVSVFERI